MPRSPRSPRSSTVSEIEVFRELAACQEENQKLRIENASLKEKQREKTSKSTVDIDMLRELAQVRQQLEDARSENHRTQSARPLRQTSASADRRQKQPARPGSQHSHGGQPPRRRAPVAPTTPAPATRRTAGLQWPQPCHSAVQTDMDMCAMNTVVKRASFYKRRSKETEAVLCGWRVPGGFIQKIRTWRLLQMQTGFLQWLDKMPIGGAESSRTIKNLLWVASDTDQIHPGILKLNRVCRELERAWCTYMMLEWREDAAESTELRCKAAQPLPADTKERVNTIMNLAKQAAAAQTSDDVLTACARSCVEFTSCEEAWAMVCKRSDRSVLQGFGSDGTAVEISMSSSRESIIGSCLESGKVQSCDSVELLRRFNPSIDRINGIGAGVYVDSLCVPLPPATPGGEQQGVLFLVNHPAPPGKGKISPGFSGSQAFVITQLAELVTPILHRSRCTLDAQVRLTNARPSAFAARDLLTKNRPLVTTLEMLLRIVLEVIGADEATVMLNTPDSAEMTLVACQASDPDAPTCSKMLHTAASPRAGKNTMGGICGSVMATNSPIVTEDATNDARWNPEIDAYGCGFKTPGWMMVVPVPSSCSQRVLGTLSARFKHKGEPGFEELDVELLAALAEQVGFVVSQKESARDMSRLTRNLELTREAHRLSCYCGMHTATSLEGTVRKVMEKVQTWFNTGEVGIFLLDPSQAGTETCAAARFLSTGDMKRLTFSHKTHSLTQSMLGSSRHCAAQLFQKMQYEDDYNNAVDLKITHPHQDCLIISLFTPAGVPCAVIQAASNEDSPVWESCIADQAKCVAPFLASTLERLDTATSLSQMDLQMKALLCTTTYVDRPRQKPLQDVSSLDLVNGKLPEPFSLPGLLTQVKSNLGAKHVALFLIHPAKTSKASSSLELVESTDEGSASDNQCQITPELFQQLQKGIPIRCNPAEVRWFGRSAAAVGDEEMILSPIHLLSDSSRVFATLQVDIDCKALFNDHFFHTISLVTTFIGGAVRAMRWDIPRCLSSDRLDHLWSWTQEHLKGRPSVDDLGEMLQLVRHCTGASLAALYVLKPPDVELRPKRVSKIANLETKLTGGREFISGATDYMIPAAVSTAHFSGVDNSVEIPFGNGLLGSCALERRDMVADLDISYTGPLNPGADLPILAESTRGFACTCFVDHASEFPKAIGILQVLQSALPFSDHQITQLRLCASILLGTGLVARAQAPRAPAQ